MAFKSLSTLIFLLAWASTQATGGGGAGAGAGAGGAGRDDAAIHSTGLVYDPSTSCSDVKDRLLFAEVGRKILAMYYNDVLDGADPISQTLPEGTVVFKTYDDQVLDENMGGDYEEEDEDEDEEDDKDDRRQLQKGKQPCSPEWCTGRCGVCDVMGCPKCRRRLDKESTNGESNLLDSELSRGTEGDNLDKADRELMGAGDDAACMQTTFEEMVTRADEYYKMSDLKVQCQSEFCDCSKVFFLVYRESNPYKNGWD